MFKSLEDIVSWDSNTSSPQKFWVDQMLGIFLILLLEFLSYFCNCFQAASLNQEILLDAEGVILITYFLFSRPSE